MADDISAKTAPMVHPSTCGATSAWPAKSARCTEGVSRPAARSSVPMTFRRIISAEEGADADADDQAQTSWASEVDVVPSRVVAESVRAAYTSTVGSAPPGAQRTSTCASV